MEAAVQKNKDQSTKKSSSVDEIDLSRSSDKALKKKTLSRHSSKESQQPNESQEAPPSTVDLPLPRVMRCNVGKYRLIRTLGTGNFAKVKLATHLATGIEVAIKIINKRGLDKTCNDRLRREVGILRKLNHPNIVRLLEIIENDDVICLVLEYANGGEIFDYLVTHGKMHEKEARSKFRQLVSAMDYCHSQNIVHRDLKAENILLDAQLNVKVADFGLANAFADNQKLGTFCGSPPYAAPELFLGMDYHGPGVDVWSMGVLLFTLVVGHLPFDAANLRDLRTKILSVHYDLCKGEVSNDLLLLLKKMLILDPRERYSLRAIMNDRWLNTGYDSLMTPYKEPSQIHLKKDYVEHMLRLGFTEVDLMNSILTPGFDHVYATYSLLPEMLKKQSLDIPSPEGSGGCGAGGVGEGHEEAAVGRFTVDPAKEATRRQTGLRAQRQLVTATSSYSNTSSLPAALKRAFAGIGRSIIGQASSTATPATNVTNKYSVSAGRAHPSAAADVKHHKSKDLQPRAQIKPAPIPLITRQKRGGQNRGQLSPSVSITSTAVASSSVAAAGATSGDAATIMTVSKVAAAIVEDVIQNVLEEFKETGGSAINPRDRASDAMVVVVEGKNLGATASTADVALSLDSEHHSVGVEQRHTHPHFEYHSHHSSTRRTSWTRNFLRSLTNFLQGPSKQASAPTQLIGGERRQIHSRPREVRNPWGVHVISTKTPSELMNEVKRALTDVKGCQWEVDTQWMYLLHCGWSEMPLEGDNSDSNTEGTEQEVEVMATATSDMLQWEVEVCSISRLHQRAVCLNRIHGSAIQFQKVATQIMATLRP